MLKNSSYLWWQENGTGWIKEIKDRKSRQVYYHIQELVLFDYFSRSNFTKVLEFGCGFGRHLQYLRELPNLDVFGYDQSESMVTDMLDWAEPNWIDRHIKIGSPTEPLPYPDNYFDAVFTTSVLIHVPPDDIEKIIQELLRVAKTQVIHQEPSSSFEVCASAHNGCWNHNIIEIYKNLGFKCDVLRPAFKTQNLYRVSLDTSETLCQYSPNELLLDKLFSIEDTIQTTLDTLTQERDISTQERDIVTHERDILIQERNTLVQERNALAQERNTLVQERNALAQERNTLVQGQNILVQERNTLVQERNTLVQKRDILSQEREYFYIELEKIIESRTWKMIQVLKTNSLLKVLGNNALSLTQYLNKEIKSVENTFELSLINESNNESTCESESESQYQFSAPIILHKYCVDSPISIVIICFNKESELPYVILSIAKNSLRPDLIVLCDDNSTDESVKIFIQCCKRYTLNFKIVREEERKNSFRLNTLRNNGVSECLDGLVIIIDADHTLSPTHIQSHVDLHLSNPCPTLSTGPRLEYANPDCTGPVNFLWGHEPISMMQPSSKEPIPSWTGILVSNMGMCKQSILNLGGFDPIYDGNYGFDDVDFTYRAWLAGYFLAGCFEAHVIHIPHPPSLGKRDGEINKQKFQDKYNLKVKYPSAAEKLTRSSWNEYFRSIKQDL